MAQFAGKQPGYPDPTMEHDSGIATPACTETIVFAGKQAGAADPTMIGCLKKLPEEKCR